MDGVEAPLVGVRWTWAGVGAPLVGARGRRIASGRPWRAPECDHHRWALASRTPAQQARGNSAQLIDRGCVAVHAIKRRKRLAVIGSSGRFGVHA